MPTAVADASPSSPAISFEDLLIDYPEADVVLRSRDSHEFRVLKFHIVHSSPILKERLSLSPNPQHDPKPRASAIPSESKVEETKANPPCMVQLPVEGVILFSLLTYTFPVPPVLPSTVEQIMELLSVAQMYKMDVALTHIRNHIAQQEPQFIREETAFLIYSLAQKHGLRTEALQAARCTLSFSSLIIDDLAKEEKLDMMPGAYLHELWEYHEMVRLNLALDLEEFRKSNAHTSLGLSLSCGDSNFPHWLECYISKIGTARVPVFLDLADFHMALTKNVANRSSTCKCGSCTGVPPRKKMRTFWEALQATVHRSIAKAETDFALHVEEARSEDQTGPSHQVASPPKYSDMPNADIILQSSDLVRFRVHKLVLAASSPFFGDLFSLPQPPSDTAPDEPPVVPVSEDAEVLNSLISMLYPGPPEIPCSSDSILAVLAAAAKYDMEAVQASIRAEVSCRGLLSPTGVEVFRVYAIASSEGLIPEAAMAARLTLGYPLTFESLGDALRLFDGWALRDLAEFRLRSMHSFSTKWEPFSDCLRGASKIWVGCPTAKSKNRLPSWLRDCLRLRLTTTNLYGHVPADGNRFSETIPTSAQLCDKYLKALQSHVKEEDCNFCMKVHTLEGEAFCAKMKDISAQAWNVPTPMLEERPGTPRMVINSPE